jgi:transposase
MPTRGQAWPREVRERAVRMVLEHQHEHGSQWETICSVAEKLGPTAETVRKWVRRAEVDGGLRPGRPSEETEELRRLRRENVELRRANDILKTSQCAAINRRSEMLCGAAFETSFWGTPAFNNIKPRSEAHSQMTYTHVPAPAHPGRASTCPGTLTGRG